MLWVDTIQMGTHNICPYEEVDKNYTGCNLKTTELLEWVLIGACAVIRLNTVCAKCADSDHTAHLQNIIQVFAFHLYML